MAQSDNTLGAPTEGLGQTVTFAAGGQSGVPQTTAGQRGTLRGQQQAQGAQTSTRAQIDTRQRSDGTAQLLYKMGSEFLRPHVEAAQTEQYFKGMQEASAGNAITDIVADQPWYSKVFGSTSLVDGARAYSANAVAQNFSVMAETEMPKLRTMSPAEIQKWSVDKMAAGKTGDPGTDALAMQAMSKVLPRIYERQTKENLLWHTENLTKSFLASGAAGASALTATLSRSTEQSPFGSLDAPRGDSTTEVDKLAAGVDYVTSLVRPDGMPEATHNRLLVQVAKGMMDSKQLGAFNVLKKSGLVGALPIEYKDALDKYEHRTELELRADLPPTMHDELARVMVLRDTADTPEESAAANEASVNFNKMYETTGATRPWFGSLDLVTSKVHAQKLQIRDEEVEANRRRVLMERAATKAEASDLANLENRTNARLLRVGGAQGVKGEHLANAWAELRGDPDKVNIIDVNVGWTEAAISQAGHTRHDDEAKGFLTAAVKDVMYSPNEFDKIYRNRYLPLLTGGGAGLASTYFGNDPKQAAALAIYHANMVGKDPKDANAIGVAHANATKPLTLQLPRIKDGTLTPDGKVFSDAMEANVKGVAKRASDEPWWSRAGTPTNSAVKQYIEQAFYLTKEMPPTMPQKEQAAMAFNQMEANGVTLLGGYLIEARGGAPKFVDALRSYEYPKDSKGIRYSKVPKGSEHDAVNATVAHFVDATGMEDAQVIQATGTRPDDDAALLLIGNVKVKGVTEQRYFTLSSRVIAERYAALHPYKEKLYIAPKMPEKMVTTLPQAPTKASLLGTQANGPLAGVKFQ